MKNCKNCGSVVIPDLEGYTECNECGLIINPDGSIERYGVASYRFPDIDYEYTNVFKSNKEIEDFIKYANDNSYEYSKCEIFTPTGYIKII